MRWLAIALLVSAACTVRGAMTPTMPGAVTDSAYGWQNGVADLGFVAAGDVMFYTSDRVHASHDTVMSVIAAWAFAWGVTDGAIHYAHGNAVGAVAGPALKLGVPYLMLRSKFFARHTTLAAFVVIALDLIDDAGLARRF